MSSLILSECKSNMQLSMQSLQKEFATLRTGRASAGLLDSIKVDAYGSPTPISQIGNISVPEARLITVQVWDKGLVKSLEKAIIESEIGLNPMVDGQLVRIPLPELTTDRRKEIAKIASQYAEKGRVALRNIRRDCMDQIKKMEKDNEMSKDDAHKANKDIQDITDEFVKKVDDMLVKKEHDIMSI